MRNKENCWSYELFMSFELKLFFNKHSWSSWFSFSRIIRPNITKQTHVSRLVFVITVGWIMGVYEFTIGPPKESSFAYFMICFRATDKLGNSRFRSLKFSIFLQKPTPKQIIWESGMLSMLYIGHENSLIRIILLLEQRLIPESEPLFVGVSASFYLSSHTFNETFFGIVKLYWLFWALEREEKSLMAFMLTASGFFMTQFLYTFEYQAVSIFLLFYKVKEQIYTSLSGLFLLSKLPWKYRQANNHRSCFMWINVLFILVQMLSFVAVALQKIYYMRWIWS